MRTTYIRQALFSTVILISTVAFAQSNAEKIKAKWSVEKFEPEKNTPQAIKAVHEFDGAYLTFGKKELIVSKKTETGETIIKRGPYSVSANSIILGKDQDPADILLLTAKNLTIKVPGQGVLYLTKQ